MRFLKLLWRTIKTIFGPLVTILRQLYRAFMTVMEGLIYPVLDAIWRVVEAILRVLWRAVTWVLERWARVFRPAPRSERVGRPTPGINGIPLTASVATTIVWFATPAAEWLDLGGARRFLSIVGTWLIVFLLARWIQRAERPGRISQWFIDVEKRAGLARFEQLSALGSLALVPVTIVTASTVALVPLMALVSFVVLLSHDDGNREIDDDLPDGALPSPSTELPDGTLPPVQEVDADEVVMRNFSWLFQVTGRNRDVEISVAVDHERYSELKASNPLAPVDLRAPDFGPWVIDGHTPEVDRTAVALRNWSRDLELSQFEEILLGVTFVQSVEYSSDEETTEHVEYWRYPIETIYDETGDCEDTTILLAAVLRTLGHEVLPLVTKNHAALAIAAPRGLPGHFVEYDGRSYYYCETTSSGWELGQLPDSVAPSDIRICPLRVPHATVTG